MRVLPAARSCGRGGWPLVSSLGPASVPVSWAVLVSIGSDFQRGWSIVMTLFGMEWFMFPKASLFSLKVFWPCYFVDISHDDSSAKFLYINTAKLTMGDRSTQGISWTRAPTHALGFEAAQGDLFQNCQKITTLQNQIRDSIFKLQIYGADLGSIDLRVGYFNNHECSRFAVKCSSSPHTAMEKNTLHSSSSAR